MGCCFRPSQPGQTQQRRQPDQRHPDQQHPQVIVIALNDVKGLVQIPGQQFARRQRQIHPRSHQREHGRLGPGRRAAGDQNQHRDHQQLGQGCRDGGVDEGEGPGAQAEPLVGPVKQADVGQHHEGTGDRDPEQGNTDGLSDNRPAEHQQADQPEHRADLAEHTEERGVEAQPVDGPVLIALAGAGGGAEQKNDHRRHQGVTAEPDWGRLRKRKIKHGKQSGIALDL